jgi:DNA-binding MarR family transcriptional regulator
LVQSKLHVPQSNDVDEIGSIMRLLGRQHATLSDETARFFMDVELTMPQLRAMVTIRRHGRQTGRELAGRLHVTPGTLVPLIDRLEEQGYVRRVPDHEDRRLTWLELTPKSERLFERLWGMGAARLAGAIARLMPKERADLRRLLRRVTEHLEVVNEKAATKKVSA